MRPHRLATAALWIAAAVLSAADAPAASGYRYAYYLFVDHASGCESCYIPLLLTPEPLEQIATGRTGAESFLVTTYERDSIWAAEGPVRVLPGDVDPRPRIIRMKQRQYRYQEITAGEVVKLLRNPGGQIPIHRPVSRWPNGPSREDLIAQFRKLK